MDSTFSEQDMLLIHLPSCLTHAFQNLEISTLSVYSPNSSEKNRYNDKNTYLTPYPLYLRVDDTRIDLTKDGAKERVKELLSHEKWFRTKKVEVLRLENERGHVDLEVLLVPGDWWDVSTVDHLTLYHTAPTDQIDINDLVHIVTVNEFWDKGLVPIDEFEEELELLFTEMLRPLDEFFRFLCRRKLKPLIELSTRHPSAVFGITLSNGDISILLQEW